MLKKLLLIEGRKKFQFDEEKELIEHLLGKNYYKLTKKEQMKLMSINAFFKVVGTKMKVDTLSKTKEELKNMNFENTFVVYDEKTYILSLLIADRAMLLESTTSNIYTDGLDKSEIKENYIIVNKFAQELLINYIKKLINQNNIINE